MRALEQTPIVFTVAVSQNDWDAELGGWRCSALRIPGAEVDNVFVEGTSMDKTRYFVWREYEMIRWTSKPEPKTATISIKLTEALSTKKKTDFWKTFSALAPIVAALITVMLSYFLLHTTVNPITGDSREPVVFDLSTPVLGQCGTVTINGSAKMPTGSRRRITRLLWDWGDGDILDSPFPAIHRYKRNGIISVKLTAYTSNNETEDRTIPVNITTADPKCQ
jgi:hypothetical protein